MSVIHLNQENFEEEVLKAQMPVLVDFWAEWCGPCKMISPIIDEVAKAYEGKCKVGKVNVDEAQDLAAKFNIMSIPTLLVFKEGEIADQMVGAMSKEQLSAKIEALV